MHPSSIKYGNRSSSRYGFGKMEVGESIVIVDIFSRVRRASYTAREKWGTMFLVKDLGDGKVQIERYK